MFSNFIFFLFQAIIKGSNQIKENNNGLCLDLSGVQFGEVDDSDDEDGTVDGVREEYCQDFVTEQLCRITKMAGLSATMQIYPGRPMLIRSNVGSLGKISIFIKSKEQLESESHACDSDSDSD